MISNFVKEIQNFNQRKLRSSDLYIYEGTEMVVLHRQKHMEFTMHLDHKKRDSLTIFDHQVS